MPGSFNIKLDKDVLVVAIAGGLNFIEDLANQLRRPLGLTQRHDALTLAAAVVAIVNSIALIQPGLAALSLSESGIRFNLGGLPP